MATRRQHTEDRVIDTLNSILEHEGLAGVVRYMHYSFMIFGYSRLPIVRWMRDQANESLQHAAGAGEHITALGGHPSLAIGKLLETHHHDIDQILREAMEHEKEAAAMYRKLLDLVKDGSVALEEYARTMVAGEENHINEVAKMLRRPETPDAD
ncbi:MAG TPA: ferritin-like domain-containing protein [Candidatus Binatia bacterium]